jgi:hypothetical protein
MVSVLTHALRNYIGSLGYLNENKMLFAMPLNRPTMR